jgi:hypothetical protein
MGLDTTLYCRYARVSMMLACTRARSIEDLHESRQEENSRDHDASFVQTSFLCRLHYSYYFVLSMRWDQPTDQAE